MGQLCYKCDRSTLDVSNSKIFIYLLLGHLEKKMREHVSRQKKTTTSFSIPSLKHPTPGFGLESSAISRQAVSKIQPLHRPVTHDISRIPLRSQAKLSISQPGDIYEQEADSVAQQVMQRMAQPVNHQPMQREAVPEEELQMKPLANSITPLVQREEVPEEEEEELQMKSLDNRTLQREEVPEEEEEELQMKSLDNRTLQREEVPEEEEEELQMKSLDNSTLQREQAPEEEELQMKPTVQRQAGIATAPDLETSINQARGGGQSLANNIRKPMERAFGADFSGVKVHTDGQSDQLNRSIQARAFTTGQDVFFRSGEYNPGSRGGQELLAHELTHVVQQNGGAVQRQRDSTDESLLQGESGNDVKGVKDNEGDVEGSSIDIEPLLTQSSALQRMQEGTSTPVIDIKGDNNADPGIYINGLIMCVGVVAKIYSPNGGMDYQAVAGGHFVTPDMYDVPTSAFTPTGEAFIVAMQALVAGYPANDIEWDYHVGIAAVEGAKPKALEEARQAATALKGRLGQGTTVDSGSSIKVNI
ncbi:MAG: DUF4157 domain-containing protein [Nostoc sp.]|uniref:eCIS core domain-containing protein n=1 Tax=Nostoc sp. TaxID=1180 RepID=UPI002FF758E4